MPASFTKDQVDVSFKEGRVAVVGATVYVEVFGLQTFAQKQAVVAALEAMQANDDAWFWEEVSEWVKDDFTKDIGVGMEKYIDLKFGSSYRFPSVCMEAG